MSGSQAREALIDDLDETPSPAELEAVGRCDSMVVRGFARAIKGLLAGLPIDARIAVCKAALQRLRVAKERGAR